MRNCPLCGKKVRFAMPELLQIADGKWGFAHHCSDKAFIFICSDTKEELLQIWEGKHGEEHPSEQ